MSGELAAHAVILAGGRGTRFWPRSRTRTPKQLLNIVGQETMLQQTARRLAPVFPPSRLWVVTNDEQVRAVRRNLPRLPVRQALSEPVGRNTAAAIALAAIHIQRVSRRADALMAVLPADHFIADAPKYQQLVRAALDVASQGANLVVLGVPPTHPETGFGYIERETCVGATRWVARTGMDTEGKRATHRVAPTEASIFAVKRFTEKPSLADAERYLASGNYYWNAGMFFWRVSTFLDCLQKHLPKTHAALASLAKDIGTSRYARSLRRIYPKLENISVDYAIMEPATRPVSAGSGSRVFVIPAEVGWSDIGSWSAVYDLLAKAKGENVSAGPLAAIDSEGNFLWSPKKFVGAVGVRDLVLVETDDAILLCPRSRAQDVSKLVKWLEERRSKKLL